MYSNKTPVPHLTTAYSGPLYPIEKTILKKAAIIESWFRQQWKATPPPITSSVDLRNAGMKLAPVDTNLFPAGFNNLNPDFLPLCIQAAQATLFEESPACRNILLLPENHTRNRFYLESVNILRDIVTKAGFEVRVGSLDPELTSVREVVLEQGERFFLEPLQRTGDLIHLDDFTPCLILLNNDLSSGLPEILKDIKQPIRPTAELGWEWRQKSIHFNFFDALAIEFSELINIDPWFINPYFHAIEGVDFMGQEGLEQVAQQTDILLAKIKEKYSHYEIKEKPFVVIKADNGTYGMSVMMVNHGEELRQLNRKQRTKMATTKGNRKVDKVLIQEGVYTFETMPDGSVAEPVVYMIGPFVVGGFYRVHQERGPNENLNSPGMHFEPLAFAQACNMPHYTTSDDYPPNRFYTYGVIARLAALAAAKEIAAIGEK